MSKIAALRVPVVPDYIEHAYYKFYAFVRPEYLQAGWNRDRILAEISLRDVTCFSGSCSEIYQEKAFDDSGFRPQQSLPVSAELGNTSLMFLVHPTLGRRDMEAVCLVVEHVMSEASVTQDVEDSSDYWIPGMSANTFSEQAQRNR